MYLLKFRNFLDKFNGIELLLLRSLCERQNNLIANFSQHYHTILDMFKNFISFKCSMRLETLFE